MRRHLASLRSICETFGDKPAYCVCGQLAYNTLYHFSGTEYETLSKEKQLVEWRGMTVQKEQ